MNREEILSAAEIIQQNALTEGGSRVRRELDLNQAISIVFRREELREENNDIFENSMRAKKNQIEKCWRKH